MNLKSAVFHEGEPIPARYSGEGNDISPPLRWSHVPELCQAFVLFCEDPDAPEDAGPEHPFVHWNVYNISPAVTSLPEGLPQKGRLDLPVTATQGRNSFGHIGYNGPMPPEGHGRHNYFFTLYALREELALGPGATIGEVQAAMEGKIMDVAQLVGTYKREARWQGHEEQKGLRAAS